MPLDQLEKTDLDKDGLASIFADVGKDSESAARKTLAKSERLTIRLSDGAAQARFDAIKDKWKKKGGSA